MSKSWFGTIEGVKCYFPLFNAIFCYLFLCSLKELGSTLWAPTSSNWPHHGSSFCQAWPKEYFGLCAGWDQSRQARATVSAKCVHFDNAFYTVALTCGLRSHPPQGPKYSLGHAWQKPLPLWGQLEGVWADRIDLKVPSTNREKNSRK